MLFGIFLEQLSTVRRAPQLSKSWDQRSGYLAHPPHFFTNSETCIQTYCHWDWSEVLSLCWNLGIGSKVKAMQGISLPCFLKPQVLDTDCRSWKTKEWLTKFLLSSFLKINSRGAVLILFLWHFRQISKCRIYVHWYVLVTYAWLKIFCCSSAELILSWFILTHCTMFSKFASF